MLFAHKPRILTGGRLSSKFPQKSLRISPIYSDGIVMRRLDFRLLFVYAAVSGRRNAEGRLPKAQRLRGEHRRILRGAGMQPLTKRQREILDYLNEFIQQHGYAPSLEEIGER